MSTHTFANLRHRTIKTKTLTIVFYREYVVAGAHQRVGKRDTPWPVTNPRHDKSGSPSIQDSGTAFKNTVGTLFSDVHRNTGSRGAPIISLKRWASKHFGKGARQAVCFCPAPSYLHDFSNTLRRRSISPRATDATHRASVKTPIQPATSIQHVFEQRGLWRALP